MTSIKCIVDEIIYHQVDSDWAVVTATKYDSKSDTIAPRAKTKLVGPLADVRPGSLLELEGEYKNDDKYGMRFEVESYYETMPDSLYGLRKFLGSGIIKGLGASLAKAIVARFGSDTARIIDEEPERLREIPKIGKKKLAQIKESWDEYRDQAATMISLQEMGISVAYANKIRSQYHGDAVKSVRENPYRLADDIKGIGFKMADEIASHIGYSRDDERRCRSGIVYALRSIRDEGHTYATRQQLMRAAKELLGVDEEVINHTLETLEFHNVTIEPDDTIYLNSLLIAEREVADNLQRLTSNPTRRDVSESDIKDGGTYNSEQRDAIVKSLSEKVLVLTGGPGTGKTTTIKGMISEMRRRDMEILLAAPTGRAAKRMSEATGMNARTIHRLLEFNPNGGFKRNFSSQLEGDVLIVDECSMIDLELFRHLVEAVPDKMQLILVGDVNQLPSIGAGNVLRDIIDSGKIPVVHLTQIYRQSEASKIVTNAYAVNMGHMPDLHNHRDSDFFFISKETSEEIADTIVELVRDRLPRAYSCTKEDIQVLTPMQKGVLGTDSLNKRLQDAINPRNPIFSKTIDGFRTGDKVMQTVNNYDKKVFNGDIGIVAGVVQKERMLTVNFDDKNVKYHDNEFNELVLAYAITIHKSQGAEFPIVVIPMTMDHYVMLQRNLLYTAITRAKRICIIVGSERAIGYATTHNPVFRRNSKLKERIRKALT
jgi:exodeoxyribonuclease V alpha subunit